MGLILRFLGTGAAEPIPTPGCSCANCTHALQDSSARRSQSGMVLIDEGGQYVVDCGPAAVSGGHWVDAKPIKGVFISHLHPDHGLGLYSIRWTKQKSPVPTFLPPDTSESDRDGLAHESVRLENWLSLRPTRLDPYSVVAVDGLSAIALELCHGNTPTQGFLFESGGVTIAYLIDSKGLPERTAEILRGIETIDCVVVDATYRPGRDDPRHNNVDEAIDLGVGLGARLVVLTHIGHHNLSKPELETYVEERTTASTDQTFICAYDGLTLTF